VNLNASYKVGYVHSVQTQHTQGNVPGPFLIFLVGLGTRLVYLKLPISDYMQLVDNDVNSGDHHFIHLKFVKSLCARDLNTVGICRFEHSWNLHTGMYVASVHLYWYIH